MSTRITRISPKLRLAQQGILFSSPNLLRLVVDLGGQRWHAVCVYLPTNKEEANEVIRRLLHDIRGLPGDSLIVIMGDMNADPFLKKVINCGAC